MIIFDYAAVKQMLDLGYDVDYNPASGAEVRFTRGSHKIDISRDENTGEWFIFSESTRHRRSDEGFAMHESIGLSNEEVAIIDDILKKAERKLAENGG